MYKVPYPKFSPLLYAYCITTCLDDHTVYCSSGHDCNGALAICPVLAPVLCLSIFIARRCGGGVLSRRTA